MVIQNVMHTVVQQEQNPLQNRPAAQNQDLAKQDQDTAQKGVILSISAGAAQLEQQAQGAASVKAIDAADNGKSQVSLSESYQEQMKSSQESADAMGESIDDMSKAMEIARRIMSGGKVPSKDESFLMEYNYEMYASAKNMAVLNKEKQEEFGSVLGDTEKNADTDTNSVEVSATGATDVDASKIMQAIGE